MDMAWMFLTWIIHFSYSLPNFKQWQNVLVNIEVSLTCVTKTEIAGQKEIGIKSHYDPRAIERYKPLFGGLPNARLNERFSQVVSLI